MRRVVLKILKENKNFPEKNLKKQVWKIWKFLTFDGFQTTSSASPRCRDANTNLKYLSWVCKTLSRLRAFSQKKSSVIRPVVLKLSKENKKFPEKNLKKKGCLHTTVPDINFNESLGIIKPLFGVLSKFLQQSRGAEKLLPTICSV